MMCCSPPPLCASPALVVRCRGVIQLIEGVCVHSDLEELLLTSSVVLQKTNSVEKALELLVGKEEVVGGSCPQSQSSQDSVFTQTSLEEMPLILMLHLKCFHYKLQTCSKIIKTVEFPIDLRIDSSTSV